MADLGLKTITIVYRRLPNKVTRIRQVLLHESAEAIVSLGLMAPSQPIVAGGFVLVGHGDLAVWFVFPEAWHDTGLVYDRERRFKGYYCDILTPVRRLPEGYETTDLLLDLWVYPDGRYLVLDRKEFTEALKRGWLSKDLAERAEAELQRLIRDVEEGRFPRPTLRRLGTLPRNAESLLEALAEA